MLSTRLKRNRRLREMCRFKNLKNKLRILLWRTKALRRRMQKRNSNYKMNVDLVKDAGIDSLAGIFILKMRKIIGGEIPGKGKHQKEAMGIMRELEETITVTATKEETSLITDNKTNLNVKDLNAKDLNA